MRQITARFLPLAAAAAFLSAGCTQDNFSQLTDHDALVFTASIADATRTSLQVDGTSGKVSWTDGDEILINGVAYTATPDEDNPSIATFTKKNSADADPQPVDGKYCASYACTYSTSKVTGELPAAQTYDGTVINAPMYAESTGTELSFKNICGLLAFNLTAKNEDTSIESITVTAKENLCGSFELVDGAASLISGSNSVTVSCNDLTLSTGEATPIYVALPKGTYTEMAFVINYTDKGIQKFSSKSEMAVAVNIIYSIDLSVESKGGLFARWSNDGGSSWTGAASLAEAIAGITATSRSKGIVELFHDEISGAAPLPDLSGKAFTLKGHGRTWDISRRSAAMTTDASTDVVFNDIVIDGKSQANGSRFLDNKGKVTFTDIEFKDIIFKVSGNAYGIILNAGGSAFKDAALTLEDCNIHDCESIGTNSYCFIDNDPGHVIMKGCKVADCKATGTGSYVRGGFIYNTQTSNIGGIFEAADCSFTNCSSAKEGGAICCFAGTATLNNVTFTDCSADKGGAIYAGLSSLNCPSSVIVNGGSIKGCDAAGDGSAAYLTKSGITFNGTEIISDGKDCVYLYTEGKAIFNDAKMVNTNAGGTVFSSGTENALSNLTVNSGYYSGASITSGSSTTDNRIYILGGYYSNNKFAAGTHFNGAVVRSIPAVQQTIGGSQYTFTHDVYKAAKDYTTKSFGAYKHVIIMGIDGAGAWFNETISPNIYEICSDGVRANNVICATPSLSAECWTSMLHGVTPAFHGRNNTNTGVEPFDRKSPYPSVFRILHEADPDAELASICNWNNVNYGIIEDGLGVTKQHATDDRSVTNLILSYLKKKTPTLMYVQYDGVDHEGHASGYGKTKHLASITTVDGYVKEVYDAIADKGILDETLFIVAVDHGGTPGGSHGGSTSAEMNTFLGIAGKTTADNQTVVEAEGRDIAAIVAYALGLKMPDTWTARVPTGIFYDVQGTERKVVPEPGTEQYQTPSLDATKALLSGHNVAAYFPFDGNANDAYGVTSTTANGKQYYLDQNFGKVLNIQDGYITLNNLKFGTGSFSVAFWVKNTSISGDPAVLSNKNWASGYNSGFIIGITSSKFQFNVGDGKSSGRTDGVDRCYVYANYPSDFSGRWMHVAVTVDRSNNEVRIYNDFTLVSTKVLSDPMKTISFDALNLNIGQDGTGAYGSHLTAYLDEMIITKDLITPSDLAAMKAHYATGK